MIFFFFSFVLALTVQNGVRALMLDTYDFEGGIWLCHSPGENCYDITAFVSVFFFFFKMLGLYNTMALIGCGQSNFVNIFSRENPLCPCLVAFFYGKAMEITWWSSFVEIQNPTKRVGKTILIPPLVFFNENQTRAKRCVGFLHILVSSWFHPNERPLLSLSPHPDPPYIFLKQLIVNNFGAGNSWVQPVLDSDY